LRDLQGRLIINNSTNKSIDMSKLGSGVYFLSISHEGKIFNKRIIKE